ncbi:hypothetical protein EJ05DRAFT_86582 [Pseudovirgaria hyperparasitica]|uniref:Uncharacterized protein n=1 Tax=Pseudovirgaria hyperparasitica TaxID=470096 RepID=A0A6A6W247_9PEZI|nr:uncharacterized protein EJ05DRAFT_86582 [Pseudovirgaria hyperparasitica]KAF2756020.1 hypothetical protein EJ05DRAFT_86582 [Pseudovirgaria hyperparasitica]
MSDNIEREQQGRPLRVDRARPSARAIEEQRMLSALGEFEQARSAVSSDISVDAPTEPFPDFDPAYTGRDDRVPGVYRNEEERQVSARRLRSLGVRESQLPTALPSRPVQNRRSRLPVPISGTFRSAAMSDQGRRPLPSYEPSGDPYSHSASTSNRTQHHQRTYSDPFEYDNMQLPAHILEYQGGSDDDDEQLNLNMPDPSSPIKVNRAPPARPTLGQHLSQLSISGTGDFGLGIWTSTQTASPTDVDDLFTGSVSQGQESSQQAEGQRTPRNKGKARARGGDYDDPDRTPRPDDAPLFGADGPTFVQRDRKPATAVTIAERYEHPIVSKDPNNPFPEFHLSDTYGEKDPYRQAYLFVRESLGQLYMMCTAKELPQSPDLLDFDTQRSRYEGKSPTSSFGSGSNMSPTSPLTVIDSNAGAIAGPRDASTSFGSMRSVTGPTGPVSPTEARRPPITQRSITTSSMPQSSSQMSDTVYGADSDAARTSTSSMDSDKATQSSKHKEFVHRARSNEWSDQTNEVSLWFIAQYFLREEANPGAKLNRDGSVDVKKFLEAEEARNALTSLIDEENDKIRLEIRTKLLNGGLDAAERTACLGILRGIRMTEDERIKKCDPSTAQCVAAWAVVFTEWAQKRDEVVIKLRRARYLAKQQQWMSHLAEMEERELLRRRRQHPSTTTTTSPSSSSSSSTATSAAAAASALAADARASEQRAERRLREADADIRAYRLGERVVLDNDARLRMTLAARRESIRARLALLQQPPQ